MTDFIKRVLQAVFVIVAVTLLALCRAPDRRPALMLSQGSGSVTEQDLANIRQALGLNRPFHEQYLSYMQGLLHGDFGRSFMGGTPVAKLIGDALPATLMLAFSSLIASILISPLASRPSSAASPPTRPSASCRWSACRSPTLAGADAGAAVHHLPAAAAVGLERPGHLVLPSLTMAIILSATNIRLVRTTMLETLSAQYIMVARSKGLKERVVLYKHALRNCAIPLITYLGLQFGGLIGGIVVIEMVFNWPGLGTLAFDAISGRDYPVLQGTVTVLAAVIVLVNLIVDIAYGIVDPRIRTR